MTKRFSTTSISWMAIVMLLFAAGCGDSDHDHKDQKVKDRKQTAGISWKNLLVRDTAEVGDTVTGAFVFYNTGWVPVSIVEAIPQYHGCTCRFPEREIPIGEQDTVFVTCPVRFTGPMRSGAKVKASSKQNPFALSFQIHVPEKED